MPALRIAGIQIEEDEEETVLRIPVSSLKLERFNNEKKKNAREESKCEERKKVKAEWLQIAPLFLKFLGSQDFRLEGWKTLYSSGSGARSSESRSEKSKSSVLSKWARIGRMAAKVGKGLSKDDKGQKLALIHWLEVIDTHHRYGHNLHVYYNVWVRSHSSQSFFYWLDDGDGKDLDLEKCPRSDLQKQCIHYCKPEERKAYAVIIKKGKLVYRQNKVPVNTTPEGSKWIFVLSTCRTLYVAEKKKGLFHHSSFLAGGATIASGRLVASHGILHAIWPYSGHYCPTDKHFQEFINFLKKHKVDLTNVKKYAIDDDVPPSNPVVDQELFQFDGRTDNINACQKEEAIVESSQVKEKKPLLPVSSKRTCGTVNGYGGRDYNYHHHDQYPISIKVPVDEEEFENLHISSARVNVSHGKVFRNKASIPTIPSPPPSVAPKAHLSSSPTDQIVRTDQHPTTPRLRVPAN
ncbi:hypothetical protein K1719_009186 [Acacia pycnantha]|nr:hypothetical protein K1719_009186 [Acacia pycnantha]